MKKKWYRSKWIYWAITLLLGALIGIVFQQLFDAINGVISWKIFLHYLGWTLLCTMNCMLSWDKIELVRKEEN